MGKSVLSHGVPPVGHDKAYKFYLDTVSVGSTPTLPELRWAITASQGSSNGMDEHSMFLWIMAILQFLPQSFQNLRLIEHLSDPAASSASVSPGDLGTTTDSSAIITTPCGSFSQHWSLNGRFMGRAEKSGSSAGKEWTIMPCFVVKRRGGLASG